MYKIFLDNNLLHDIYIHDLKIYNPKVVLEQNGIDSFEFSIYPTHQFYNNIKPLKSIVTVYQHDHMIFRGRVLEVESTMNNAKSIYCEGECGFMCDSVQYPYSYQGSISGLFNKVIETHNSQVDATKQFKVGKITVTDKNDYIVRSDSTYLSTWETIKKKFIELLGGYIQIRHESDGNYIDYLSDFTDENIQKVIFGENMLSVKRTNHNSDICTVLIPLGAKNDNGERLDITSVNDGKMYIENAENITRYGRIVKAKIWDDVTVADNLKNKATKELAEMGKKVETIEISAVDMANINRDISNFIMHQKIRVISNFHKIDDSFIPMKMNISLFNPKSNKITLNGTVSTLTSTNSSVQTTLGALVNSVSTVENSTAVIIPAQLQDLKKEVDRNKDDADVRIIELNAGVKQVETQIDETDLSVGLLGQRIVELNEEVKTVGNDISSLSIKFDSKYKNDVEWTEITLTGFKSFSENSKPEYRIKGSVLEVRGCITPLRAIPSQDKTTFAKVPKTPTKEINKVCQGSDKATWILTISEQGELQCSQYGTTSAVEIPVGAKLSFNEVYTI